jgi:Kelch motif/Galactose oxidase, central domain
MPPRTSGRMVAAAEMTSPRAAHTATLLKDGSVLVAGGCTLDGCEMSREGATAELYDSRSRSFSTTGPMTTERVSHTATLLSDGRVLVAGGWDRDGVLKSAELYDPATGAFSPTEDMASARAAHTASLLPDGKVLLAGGYDGERSVSGAEVYDPDTNGFARTGGMSTARSAHAAARLPDGRILVTGGIDARGNVVQSTEIYAPGQGRFVGADEMSAARYKHAAVSLDAGTVLVVGGSDEDDFYGKRASAEVYNPETDTFATVSSMNTERFKLPDAVATLAGGGVLVGGDGRHAEFYNPESRSFHPVRGDVGSPRAFATTVPLAHGKALVAGGYDDNIHPTNNTWLYVP